MKEERKRGARKRKKNDQKEQWPSGRNMDGREQREKEGRGGMIKEGRRKEG